MLGFLSSLTGCSSQPTSWVCLACSWHLCNRTCLQTLISVRFLIAALTTIWFDVFLMKGRFYQDMCLEVILDWFSGLLTPWARQMIWIVIFSFLSKISLSNTFYLQLCESYFLLRCFYIYYGQCYNTLIKQTNLGIWMEVHVRIW